MWDRKLWIVFIIFFAIVIVSGFGMMLTENAAKYAQVSREMLENKEWINLTIGGDAYDQKPPLMFWAGAVFYSIFGISDDIFRLSVLFVSLIGIFATYKLAYLLYNKTTAILAAFFWVVSLGYIYFHNDAHTDTVLASMVMLAIWLLVRYFEKGNLLCFFCGIVAVGLAMLSKGPVGLIIPASAVGAHLLYNRRWHDIFSWKWLVAIPLLLLTITPALAGLYNQFGMEGIKFYFWTNNMGRITGSYQGSNTDPVFYLHTALYVLAPFTVFAFGGIIKQIAGIISALRRKQKFTYELFTLGGIIPYILVLSVAKAKNPHYLMAVIPLMMILGAQFASEYANGMFSKRVNQTVKSINILIITLFWATIALFVFWFFPEKSVKYWTILGLFIVNFLVLLLSDKSFKREIGLLTISFFAFMFSFHYSIYPKLRTYHAPFQAVAFYNENAADGEEIHIYRNKARYWEILFYAKNPGHYYVDENSLEKLLSERSDWVFTDPVAKDQILDKVPDAKLYEFTHRQISRQSPAFLNPKTRQTKLSKLYLLKLPD